MTILRNNNIIPQDSWNIDAFGRGRISETGQRFDCEFIYDKQPQLFAEVTTNTGSVVHNSDSRDVTLTTGDVTDGTTAGLYQKYYNPYTPGNSQLVDITGTMDNTGLGTGTASLFLRNGIDGSETEITQNDWNGEDVSNVDWSKSQILMMDFQSLKIGRIRFFLVRSGIPILIHQIVNDNVRSGGYWQSPSLPINWEIYNTATETIAEMGYFDDDNGIGLRYTTSVNATASMRAICCTVKSEGGKDVEDIPGYIFSADNGTTPKTVSTTLIPLLTIRPKLTLNSITHHGLIIPNSYSISSDNPILYRIISNATLTGATWTDVDTTNSAVEYDVASTAITGGIIRYSNYLATDKNTFDKSTSLLGKILLAIDRNTNYDTLTIAAVRTTTTDASVFLSFGWKEIR